MTELVLMGPFLTRAQAARRAGLTSHDVALRPGLLRVRGKWLEEAYFAFQFGERGIRRDLARVVQSMKDRCDDATIADWLVRPNPQLHQYSPLDRLRSSAHVERVMSAAASVETRAAPPPARPASGLGPPLQRPGQARVWRPDPASTGRPHLAA